MQLIEDINDFRAPAFSVVTSGTFDGVHVGHQRILDQIKETALLSGGQSMVLTYWPHPRFVLGQSGDLKLLSTFDEKTELLADSGIDFLVKIPFTKEFASLSSEEFIKKILVEKLNTHQLVIGYDHRFGKNREGSFEYLSAHSARYGFEVTEIPRQDVDHVGVSSTKVREALLTGDLHVAKEFLGRPYTLSGYVKDGDRIGRSIGFPTANIEVLEDYKLIPGDGAYAVFAAVNGQEHMGMLNIGWRPTVSGQERRIEVHLFDFDENIYNKRVTIRFIELLRKEKKFDGIESLKQQLIQDEEAAKKILGYPGAG